MTPPAFSLHQPVSQLLLVSMAGGTEVKVPGERQGGERQKGVQRMGERGRGGEEGGGEAWRGAQGSGGEGAGGEGGRGEGGQGEGGGSRRGGKKGRETLEVAGLLGLCLLCHRLLPYDWVGGLPHCSLASPQGVQRHLPPAGIVQSPHAVDPANLHVMDTLQWWHI